MQPGAGVGRVHWGGWEMSDGGARLFRGGGRARDHGNTGGAAGITGSGQGRCPSVTQKSSLRGGATIFRFSGAVSPMLTVMQFVT